MTSAREQVGRDFDPPSSTPRSRERLKDPPYLKRSATLLSAAAFAFTATFALTAPAPPSATTAPELAPAVNWVLPIFTDKEGYRSMTLRGSEVRPSKESIVVTDLSITIFSGDAAAKVDSILLSREANFFPKENRASGDNAVRFIRDDIEVTGFGWTYDHTAQKITLQRDVRVTFSSQLKDILK